MARIVVVLPAPLGPRKPTTCPAGTSNERPSRAVRAPKVRRRPSSSSHPLIGLSGAESPERTRFPTPLSIRICGFPAYCLTRSSGHGYPAFGYRMVPMSLCRPWSWNQVRVQRSAGPGEGCGSLPHEHAAKPPSNLTVPRDELVTRVASAEVAPHSSSSGMGGSSIRRSRR